MPCASSWRSVGSASKARSGSGSTTTKARSATAVAQRAVGGEADRAGAIDQRVAVAHIIVMHQVELGRAAARARLGAGVADAGAVRHRCPAARSRRPQREGPRLGWSYPPRRGPRARWFWCLQLWWAYKSPRVAVRGLREKTRPRASGKPPDFTLPWRSARGDRRGSSHGRAGSVVLRRIGDRPSPGRRRDDDARFLAARQITGNIGASSTM